MNTSTHHDWSYLAITPSRFYERPILEILSEQPGQKLARPQVLEELECRMRLLPKDYEVQCNGYRWEFMASRSRQCLIDLDLLQKRNDGIWAVSSRGARTLDLLTPTDDYPRFTPGRELQPAEIFLTSSDLEPVLLQVLEDMGGYARRRDVLDVMELHLAEKLSAADFELKANAPRWHAIASRARQDLIIQGKLVKRKDGIWQLSNQQI
jgi:hypothetical protein